MRFTNHVEVAHGHLVDLQFRVAQGFPVFAVLFDCPLLTENHHFTLIRAELVVTGGTAWRWYAKHMPLRDDPVPETPGS